MTTEELLKRYDKIFKLIKGEAAKIPGCIKEDIPRYLAILVKAPLFNVELNPLKAVGEIDDDLSEDELLDFFAFPYRTFILNFTLSVGGITPFIVCHQLDKETYYLESITLAEEIDPQEWVQTFMQKEDEVGAISKLGLSDKTSFLEKVLSDTPLTFDRIIVKRIAATREFELNSSVYESFLCPYRSKDHIPIFNLPALPPFFHTCAFIDSGKGCYGKFSPVCKQIEEKSLGLWKLVLSTLIYVNYPRTILIEEAPQKTMNEISDLEKLRLKKPEAFDPKKPRIRIIPHERIQYLEKKSPPDSNSQQGESRARPKPHLRRGFWKTYKREDIYPHAVGDKRWITDVRVNWDIKWEDPTKKTISRVISLPTRKISLKKKPPT